MKIRCMIAFVVALSALFMSGCATVTRGTKDTLVIESDPAGADVHLSSGQSGKTPTSFKLPRGDSLVVRIAKEGYESVEVNVSSQVVGAGAAGMAGNVLVGGLIGAGVDAFSGAMKDLKPNPIRVSLVRLAAAPNSVAVNSQEAGGELTAKLRDLKAALENGLISPAEFENQRTKLLGTAATTEASAASGPPVPASPPTTEGLGSPGS